MIKRYCDKCGKQIVGRDYRIMSVTDPDGNVILGCGKCFSETLDCVELCRDCASRIINYKESTRWRRLNEEVPPLNTEVELFFVKDDADKIITDKLISMLNGTYIWAYGDYSCCNVIFWRYK